MAIDLLETIQTWRTIYSSISAPGVPKNTQEESFHVKWNKGMLKVVASLGVINELKSTPVEKHMQKAVDDGRTFDSAKLDDIYVLLGEVQKYLEEKVAS